MNKGINFRQAICPPVPSFTLSGFLKTISMPEIVQRHPHFSVVMCPVPQISATTPASCFYHLLFNMKLLLKKLSS
jgi:hypothetical protein